MILLKFVYCQDIKLFIKINTRVIQTVRWFNKQNGHFYINKYINIFIFTLFPFVAAVWSTNYTFVWLRWFEQVGGFGLLAVERNAFLSLKTCLSTLWQHQLWNSEVCIFSSLASQMIPCKTSAFAMHRLIAKKDEFPLLCWSYHRRLGPKLVVAVHIPMKWC